MCEALDRIEERGREKGRLEVKMIIAFNLRSMNMKDADIANAVDVSENVLKEWFGKEPA